jgi:hypothetical protein
VKADALRIRQLCSISNFLSRMTEVVAARLGAECAVFPGGHTAAIEIPASFAAALRGLLARLRA